MNQTLPDWLDGSCWPRLECVDSDGYGFLPCQTMDLDERGVDYNDGVEDSSEDEA